jgi:coenzyme F420-0:L-glutamate ligase/coenzyme F420-1:gamma-L-glutamate ligase
MPDLFDTIKQRRSIRKYLPRKVPKDVVLKVLDAAGWAPSAHNSQPWRFLLIENASVKRELAEQMAQAWAADLVKDGIETEETKRVARRERFANAPALILACITLENLHKFPDEKRQKCEHDLAVESLGAAMQNLLLAAHALGLGACWFCAPAFCKETVREVLKVPETVEPEALIALGYPAEAPPVPKRKAISEYCFVDEWRKEC